jgi:DNA-binding PadR family transcriptional regulator
MHHDHEHDHDHDPNRQGGMRFGGRGRGRGPWGFNGPFGPGAGPWAAEAWGGGPGGRGGRGWGRARRGDIRLAILALLNEKPMHGYEIITELSERTEGVWNPSPGSIYPTLQLLEDEGLITGETDAGGKRRFSLTEDGRRAAADGAGGRAPWEAVASGTPTSTRALLRSAATLVPVVRQVAVTGSPQDCEEASRLLDETRRGLYAILAAQPARAAASPEPDPER